MKRAKLTDSQADLIRVARSIIRDQAHGWSKDELMDDPKKVCKQLSDMLGEKYDFNEGNIE